jgi:hypothetical protein
VDCHAFTLKEVRTKLESAKFLNLPKSGTVPQRLPVKSSPLFDNRMGHIFIY